MTWNGLWNWNRRRAGVSTTDRFFLERVYLRNWKDSAGAIAVQLASLAVDDATAYYGMAAMFLLKPGFSIFFPRLGQSGQISKYLQ